jgi:hypothetical protein
MRRSFSLALAALLGACASTSSNVEPLPAGTAEFVDWSCERLQAELDRVREEAADRAYKLDQRVGANAALTLGAMVFWPVLLAIRPGGEDSAELARLKGRDDALRSAQQEHACPDLGEQMPAAQRASLPVQLGERLVYDDRERASAQAHSLVLRLTSIKRNELGFTVEGSKPETWRQDLPGNTLADRDSTLLRWHRLLKRNLTLGQALSGELVAAEDPDVVAPVEGRVMSLGEQSLAGRRFDAVVIELTGAAPQETNGGSTRLQGVMVVDRASGVLLRLELDCANPRFAVWRRLLRIEPAAP